VNENNAENYVQESLPPTTGIQLEFGFLDRFRRIVVYLVQSSWKDGSLEDVIVKNELNLMPSKSGVAGKGNLERGARTTSSQIEAVLCRIPTGFYCFTC
jgi:hypothetical protein